MGGRCAEQSAKVSLSTTTLTPGIPDDATELPAVVAAELEAQSLGGLTNLEMSPTSTAAAAATTSALSDRRRWLLTWTGRVAEFGLVQVLVQVLAGLAGIIVVRTLAKEQYALYAITNQMQTACNLLADLGIGIGVRSIGGRVWQDRRRFGELLTTALDMRRWFALFSLAGCLPIAMWMLISNGASWTSALTLCGVLVASVLPLLGSSVYLIVPQLHGEYRRIQKLDFGNAALRLAMMAALAASRMNAALAAGVGAISNWVQMSWLRRWSRDHVDADAMPNQQDRRELVSLSMRTFPNSLFFCVQGQVTLLILTLVGNPTGIADVTALGRLAVLLTAFSAAFTNVLAPRFACCQDAERLPRLYGVLLGVTILSLLPILLAAWIAPEPLLWLLGAKYEGLSGACRWVVATACVGQLLAAVWQLNVSKAWIGIYSIANIPVVLATQITTALVLDLRQFNHVLQFAFLSALAPLLLCLGDALKGIYKSRREALAADLNILESSAK